MAYKYARYIARVTRAPWAILPDKFLVISELMRERLSGHKPSDEEIAARLGDETERPRSSARTDGAIAVIPIHGTIAHRADSFEASSGGTSTEMIGKLLRKVTHDDEVSSILLDFDTPGGSVDGVPELAAQIAKAAAIKPVVAHVNALAASAGYWLASQASEIVSTPSGMAGSIGVYLLTVDESKLLEKEGVVINAISAGDHKLEGAPWEPLTEDARAHLQGQVDTVYREFLGAVAKGRGVTVAEVKERFGQGRVYDAKEALSRGMVDRIATFEEIVGLMAGGRWKPRKSGGRAETMTTAMTGSIAFVSTNAENATVTTPSVVAASEPVEEPTVPVVDESEAIADEHAAIIAARRD